MKTIVASALEKSKVLESILSELMEIDPFDFEMLMAKLFERMDYNSILTPRRKDHGIGIILRKKDGVIEQKTIVQVKRRKNPISEQYVKRLHSTLTTNPTATQAVLLTTSSFTKNAVSYVMDHKLPIILDGNKVADLLLKYGY
jgi:restriction system protein